MKGCDRNSTTPLRLLVKHLPGAYNYVNRYNTQVNVILLGCLICLDAAEVVLFRCINRIQNDKGEVTAIEMSFEFLDDFQDPIKGGICGLVHSICGSSGAGYEQLELQGADTLRPQKYPTLPIRFNKHNHVLNWMVKPFRVVQFLCLCLVCYCTTLRSSMKGLGCFNIQLLVN